MSKHHWTIFFNSVEDVEPHGGSQELGCPFYLEVNVRFSNGGVTDEFHDVMACHYDNVWGYRDGGGGDDENKMPMFGWLNERSHDNTHVIYRRYGLGE